MNINIYDPEQNFCSLNLVSVYCIVPEDTCVKLVHEQLKNVHWHRKKDAGTNSSLLSKYKFGATTMT